MSIPPFPEPGSIPPVCFYNMGGLTEWLNNHPDYKQYFVNYPRYYPYLYTQSTISELIAAEGENASPLYTLYDIRNVKMSPLVTTMNDQQSRKYKEQLGNFLRVYSFNSNAYVTSLETMTPPMYYRFGTEKERLEYRSAIGLISKLYPFEAMANGTTEHGSTLGWIIPFPL